MKKYYFTFGTSHIHKVNGIILTSGRILCMQAETYGEARQRVFELIGNKWAFQYENLSDLHPMDCKNGIYYYNEGRLI